MERTPGREHPTGRNGSARSANDEPASDSDGVRNRNRRQRSSVRADAADADASGRVNVVRYGPKHALKLFAPVSCCMTLVFLHSKFVLQHKQLDAYTPYLPFREEEQTGWDAMWKSIVIAAMFVGLVVVATSLMVFAYFMRWYKAIMAMVMLNCFILFSFMTFDLLSSIVTIYNIHGDYITLALFMYNYGTLGMISIFWTAPLMIQQAYLVMISALVSIMLLHLLPSWAIWTVLGALALWDIIAVLCPFGPLQILLKLSRERNEPIMPALIYSSGLIYMNASESRQEVLALYSRQGDRISCTEKPALPECERLLCDEEIQPNQPNNDSEARPSGFAANEGQLISASSGRAGPRSETPQSTSGTQTSTQSSNDALPINNSVTANSGGINRSEAIKLGLGDFIFYGVLIGKASEGGILATISCFIAILIGLCTTLVFLVTYGRALPALPISIFMGISFYFATYFVIDPFCESIYIRQLIL